MYKVFRKSVFSSTWLLVRAESATAAIAFVIAREGRNGEWVAEAIA